MNHYELTLTQGDTVFAVTISPADLPPDYNWTPFMKMLFGRLKELKERED